MNICQLVLICLLIHGMFNIERVDSVNKKLQKSFVEIFGEGWDEEERREEIGKVTGDWQNDGKQIEKNDQRETMTAIGDQTKQQKETSSSSRKKTDQEGSKKEMENDQLSEAQKREIIRKWYAIKERIKQRKGKQSRNDWYKTERSLAKKLGTNRSKIYKWIKKMGMRQRKLRTDDEKLVLMRKYWEMKRKDPKMSDAKIAKALKISERSIYLWKAQFREELGMKMIKRQLTDEQKREIIGAFKAIKKKFMQRNGGPKYSREQWVKMENLLAKKLGTNRCQIYKWIKELGMNQIKMRTNEEKLAIIKKYWEMKRNNPKMTEAKIAKRLNIDRTCIRKWKDDHLGEKTAFLTDPPT